MLSQLTSLLGLAPRIAGVETRKIPADGEGFDQIFARMGEGDANPEEKANPLPEGDALSDPVDSDSTDAIPGDDPTQAARVPQPDSETEDSELEVEREFASSSSQAGSAGEEGITANASSGFVSADAEAEEPFGSTKKQGNPLLATAEERLTERGRPQTTASEPAETKTSGTPAWASPTELLMRGLARNQTPDETGAAARPIWVEGNLHANTSASAPQLSSARQPALQEVAALGSTPDAEPLPDSQRDTQFAMRTGSDSGAERRVSVPSQSAWESQSPLVTAANVSKARVPDSLNAPAPVTAQSSSDPKVTRDQWREIPSTRSGAMPVAVLMQGVEAGREMRLEASPALKTQAAQGGENSSTSVSMTAGSPQLRARGAPQMANGVATPMIENTSAPQQYAPSPNSTMPQGDLRASERIAIRDRQLPLPPAGQRNVLHSRIGADVRVMPKRIATVQINNPSIIDPVIKEEPAFAPLDGQELIGLAGSATSLQSGLATQTTRASAMARPSAVLAQINEAIPRLSEGGVEIRLNPEELGRVRLQLVAGEQGMSVLIQAERPETLDLMRRNATDLERALAEAGYETTGFSFGQEGAADQGERGTSSGSSKVYRGEEHAAEVKTIKVVTDGLDIRI